ncbi:RICIN domain-containing protein [Catenulispora rubra]|uniref:RICIN domain-containing protein n=1 Tax=Catenulispora rubra TaxID=280293 RepID=UPI0018928555|nr:RICIN domain-containing protein [Catenulispora rubra]
MRNASLARPGPRRLLALFVAALLALFCVDGREPKAYAQSNGAAVTPLMGWSSWSFLRNAPTEAKMKAQAQGMANSGLVAAGYKYVNLDDFWYLDPANTVDSGGRWVTDSSKFPDGMANLGSYIHSLGEKFGMYLTPGIPVAAYSQNTPIAGTSFHARDIVSNTSSYETNYNFGSGRMYYIDYTKNPTAAQAFLNSWADQLAGYGIDYLKIDGVSPNDGDSQGVADVQHWSQALNQSGRTIHLELSNSLTTADAASWQQYSNGWRIDGDIECYCGSNSSFPLTNWNNVSGRFNDVQPWIGVGGTGGWNDLDSIEVGNGSNDGLTYDERKTQLTLWAIENSNLTLGVDLTNLDSTDVGLLTNSEVLAVDRAGHPARAVDRTTQQQAWYAANGDGSYTVALFNLSGSAATTAVNWQDIGFTGSSATVHDDWSHSDLGTFASGYSVSLPAHGTTLLKVVPTGAVSYTAMSYNIVNANSALFLATSGSSVVQQSADNALDQEWQLVPVGDGSYKVLNRTSHQQLAVPSGSQGAQLVQAGDDKATDTQWRLVPTGSGSYTLKSSSDGLCADVSGGSTSSGASVIQWPANGGANQKWTLVPVPDANQAYRVENLLTGGRLDVNNDSTADGATLLQWTDNGRADQKWTFVRQSSGAYTIVNANSGKLVNIPGPTTTSATQLIQYSDDGNSNSRWTLVDAGPGVIGLKSVYDGQLVDVSGGNTSAGTAVIQFPSNGGQNQGWTLVP